MEASDLDSTLATVHALLAAENMVDAAELVRVYPARVEQTGYDNWNGGTAIWEVYFEVLPADYARMGTRRVTSRNKLGALSQAI